MRAAIFQKTGGPEVIEIVDRTMPIPSGPKVVVRVGAMAVNPIDTYMRAGMVPLPMDPPPVVGFDFAGTVEAAGPDAKRFKRGDRVFRGAHLLDPHVGAFAEYIAIDENSLQATPDNVDDATMAALSLAGITAWLGVVDLANTIHNETLFVSGGTGGVGSLVMQIAKARGARVITTVGSEAKAEAARGLGADEVILYKQEDVAARLKELAPEGVNVWYETTQNADFNLAIDRLADKGRMIIMAGRGATPPFPVGPFYVKCAKVMGLIIFKFSAGQQNAAAEQLAKLATEGKLLPIIGRTMKFEDVAEAHRLQEGKTLRGEGELQGKIVLTF